MSYKHDWYHTSTPPTNLIDGFIGVLGIYYNGEEVYLEYEVKYEDSSYGYFTVDGDDVTKHLKGWKYL